MLHPPVKILVAMNNNASMEVNRPTERFLMNNCVKIENIRCVAFESVLHMVSLAHYASSKTFYISQRFKVCCQLIS